MLVLPAVLETDDAVVFRDDERPQRFYAVAALPRVRRREDGSALLMFVKYRTAPTASDESAGGGFLEIGPGTVLAGLAKRAVANVSVKSLGTADEVARFLEGAA